MPATEGGALPTPPASSLTHYLALTTGGPVCVVWQCFSQTSTGGLQPSGWSAWRRSDVSAASVEAAYRAWLDASDPTAATLSVAAAWQRLAPLQPPAAERGATPISGAEERATPPKNSQHAFSTSS